MSVWKPQFLVGMSNWLVDSARLLSKPNIFLIDIQNQGQCQAMLWNMPTSWFLVIAFPGIQCSHCYRWPWWFYSQHCLLWSVPWTPNHFFVRIPFPSVSQIHQGFWIQVDQASYSTCTVLSYMTLIPASLICKTAIGAQTSSDFFKRIKMTYYDMCCVKTNS